MTITVGDLIDDLQRRFDRDDKVGVEVVIGYEGAGKDWDIEPIEGVLQRYNSGPIRCILSCAEMPRSSRREAS